MSDNEYRGIKAAGYMDRDFQIMLYRRELYDKYMYLSTLTNIETEKQRLRKILNSK